MVRGRARGSHGQFGAFGAPRRPPSVPVRCSGSPNDVGCASGEGRTAHSPGVDASVRRRPARPTGARPAGRGDRATGARSVRRAGGQRQDDDARRAHRVARRRGSSDRRDRGHHVQQAGRGRARATARCRAGAARRRAPGARPGPDVPRPGPRDPARRRRRRRAAARSRRPSFAGSRPDVDAADVASSTPRSRGSSSSSASRPPTSRPIPTPGPSRGHSWRTSARSRDAAGSTSTTSSVARIGPLEDGRRRCSPAGATRCAHLLVDEVQDVDRAQLRLALLLAAPANRIFLVGDDDQSIYGWRLADVRRVLGLGLLPGLRRVDLEVNYRCPAPVVDRAVRLVEHNGSGSRSRSGARAGAAGRLVLAPDAADETGPPRAGHAVVAGRRRRRGPSWPGRTASCCPAVVVALALGEPVPGAADRAARSTIAGASTSCSADARRDRRRRSSRCSSALGAGCDQASATTAGAARATRDARCSAGRPAIATSTPSSTPSPTTRARLAELRRDDAPLTPRHRPRDEGPRVRPRRGRRAWRRAASRAPAPWRRGRARCARSRRSAGSPTSRGPGPAAR